MLIVSIFAMRMRFAYFSTTLDTVPQKKSLLVRSRNLLLSKGSYRDDSLRIMPLSPMKIPTMYFDYMQNVPHMYSKNQVRKWSIKPIKQVFLFFLFLFFTASSDIWTRRPSKSSLLILYRAFTLIIYEKPFFYT